MIAGEYDRMPKHQKQQVKQLSQCQLKEKIQDISETIDSQELSQCLINAGVGGYNL